MKKFIIVLIAASFIFGSIVTFSSLITGSDSNANSVDTNSSNNGEGMGLEGGQDTTKIYGTSRHIYGQADALVTITIFTDFDCSYCATLAPNLKAIVDTYPSQFKLIFRQYPSPSNDLSILIANATEYAAQNTNNDTFWKLHDRIFDNQDVLSREKIVELATGLGIDKEGLNHAIDNRINQSLIDQDIADGNALGINGSPTVFIDDQRAKFDTIEDLLTLISLKMYNGAE